MNFFPSLLHLVKHEIGLELFQNCFHIGLSLIKLDNLLFQFVEEIVAKAHYDVEERRDVVEDVRQWQKVASLHTPKALAGAF